MPGGASVTAVVPGLYLVSCGFFSQLPFVATVRQRERERERERETGWGGRALVAVNCLDRKQFRFLTRARDPDTRGPTFRPVPPALGGAPL